ncbi:hypothetical protein RCL1_009148 [Eukaryota sp. TZLM3-RCL]
MLLPDLISAALVNQSQYICRFPVSFSASPFFPNDDSIMALVLRQNSQITFAKPTFKSQTTNPFLPYHPESFISELTNEHVLLLNKFVAVDGHCLIVTKEFHPQFLPLTFSDSCAVAKCLREIDSFIYYNCGQRTGASQPHKHLQLIPLPLSREPYIYCPLLEVMNRDGRQESNEGVMKVSSFSFKHAYMRFSVSFEDFDFANHVFDCFCRVADFLGIEHSLSFYSKFVANISNHNDIYSNGAEDLPGYSLVITRKFIFIARRKSGKAWGISANSSAFLGSIFVDEEGLEVVKEKGLSGILEELAE